MKLLALNVGSATIKYRLVEKQGDDAQPTFKTLMAETVELSSWQDAQAIASAMRGLVEQVQRYGVSLEEVGGIAHRVVHGGKHFKTATLITDKVITKLETLNDLAPLHNPPALKAIRYFATHFPYVRQVATFDTAFHHTLPAEAYLYALPNECYRQFAIRRYGFHGLSYAYLLQKLAGLTNRQQNSVNAIFLHLGSGASMAAVARGKSIDTTMGMTPLEGLVMATRSGDLDPGIIFYLQKQGFELPEIETLLNKSSGLKGLAGDGDMRQLLARAQQGDAQAELAIEIFVYRIVKQLGAYWAILPDVQAVVFSGGIGAYAAEIRQRVIQRLSPLFGLVLDEAKNQSLEGDGMISRPSSQAEIWVIETQEEQILCQQVWQLLDSLS
jgi:acetate kinase